LLLLRRPKATETRLRLLERTPSPAQRLEELVLRILPREARVALLRHLLEMLVRCSLAALEEMDQPPTIRAAGVEEKGHIRRQEILDKIT
jgi:hypothetical protein